MLRFRAGFDQGMLLSDQNFLMAQARQYNVLFLCTGNSARSIMAECALNRWGKKKFKAFSAGSHPKGAVHPMTLETLRELNYETVGLRSKSWDEFTTRDAPRIDFVFTVCDNAAAEACPIWPGHPMTTHWGIADPAALEGSDEEKRSAFRHAYRELEERIRRFVNLNLEEIDNATVRKRLHEIGASR